LEDSQDDYDENLNFIIPKPWISETQDQTDAEINMAYVAPNRSKTIYEFGKTRRTFGQKCSFADKDAQDIPIAIGPQNDPLLGHQLKKLVNDMGLQASYQKVYQSTQTFWNKKVNKAVETTTEKNYIEIDEENQDFTNFLNKACALMEEALTHNETINIFADDFNLNADDDFDRQGGANELSLIQE